MFLGLPADMHRTGSWRLQVYTLSNAARFTLLLGVVVFLAGVQRLGGQATDANLIGTVVDQMGASIPLATVEIMNSATGIKASAMTNTQGAYRFNNILTGSY